MTDINDFGHNSFVHTKGLVERIEMTKQEELLKVLDMSGDEQDRWCALNTDRKSHEHLADLAFRLRNEVIVSDLANETGWWCEASYEVYLYIIGEENERDEVGLDTWFSMYAQPIHWIIAALIAKESK